MKQASKLMAIVSLALLFLTVSIAQAGTLRKDFLFTQARKQLIKDGWSPVNIHASDNYEYLGTERTLIESRIYEIESCAVDRPLCLFNYQRGKICLQLVTRGEELTKMRLESWSYRCPLQ